MHVRHWQAAELGSRAGQMRSDVANGVGVGRTSQSFTLSALSGYELYRWKHMISRDLDRILTGFEAGLKEILTGL